MILMSSALPWEAIRRLVASAIDIIIHLIRLPNGQRKVEEIISIEGYETGQFVLKPLFRREGEALICCS